MNIKQIPPSQLHQSQLHQSQLHQVQLPQSQVSQSQLRQSLKLMWLNYYRDNRDWLVKLGVWVSCEGERRPSASFILATLSVLEPRLTQLMPIVVDLNSNPDRVIKALGLNFTPDDELEQAIASGTLPSEMEVSADQSMKLLSARPFQRFVPAPSAITEATIADTTITEAPITEAPIAEATITEATVQDSVDLYLDQSPELPLDAADAVAVDQERSPHEVAAQHDANCSGVGRCDPFQSIRDIDVRI